MACAATEVAVRAGQVTVTLHNDGTTLHDLTASERSPSSSKRWGETVSKVISLEAGRYGLLLADWALLKLAWSAPWRFQLSDTPPRAGMTAVRHQRSSRECEGGLGPLELLKPGSASQIAALLD